MQKKIIGGLLVSMAMPFSAFALSLGEVEVYSSLNQPLNAEIEVKSATARDVNKLIVKLASEQKFVESGINRPFWLTGLRFNPITKSGKHYIKVTSSSVVREPFVNFLVDAEWPNGRLVREYTLLIDPPSFVTKAPVVTTTQAPKQVTPQVEQGLAPIQGNATDTAPELEPLPVVEPEEVAPAVESRPIDELSIVNETLPDLDLSMDGEALNEQDFSGIKPETVDVQTSEPVEYDEYIVVGDSDHLGEIPQDLSDNYTVKRGDTMSSIARKYSTNGVSLNQVMVAILKANPNAFINGNVNLVKRGAKLDIPTNGEIVAVSQSKALGIVKQQNALWREYRNKNQSVAVTPTQQPTLPVDAVEQTSGQNQSQPEQPQEQQGSQLSIVAPKTPDTAKDNADLSADNAVDSVDEITRKLLLARERVAAANLKEEELKSRISELESIATQSQAVLSLKNKKLAQMQANAEATTENTSSDELDDVFKLPESEETQVTTAEQPKPAEPAKPVANTQPVQTPAVTEPEVDVNRPDGFLGMVYDFIPGSVRDMITPFLGGSTAVAVLGILGALILLPLLLLLSKLKKKKDVEEPTPNALDINELTDTSSSLGVDVTETSSDEFDPEAFAASGVPENMSQTDIPGIEEVDLNDVPDEVPVSSDELEMGDATGVTVQTTDPDVVDDVTSEADMYVVYGLHEQAEELLRKSIRENPSKSIYYSKLMEVYKDQDKQVEFLEVAEDLKTMLDGQPSTSWDYAVTLGKEYAPEAAIFAGAVAVTESAASEDVALDESFNVDDVLNDVPSTEDAAGDSVMSADEILADVGIDDVLPSDVLEEASDQDITDISIGIMEDDASLDDIDLGEEVESALLGDDLIDDVLPDESAVENILDGVPEVTGAITSDDLDATIDPSMFDEMNSATDDVSEKADNLSEDIDSLGDFDLEGLDALDDDSLSTKALDADDDIDDGEMTQLIDDDSLETMIDEIGTDVASFSVADGDDGFDEIGTKLDLAKAYIDMGDHEGAKESLQEVIDGGNAEQKAEAEKLLSEI